MFVTRTIALLAAAATIAGCYFASAAQADTARGCRGQLLIFDSAPHSGSPPKELLASFEGRGTCRNKFHADDCRKRAADGIIRCAREMWATRNSGHLPPSCTEERGNSFARVELEGIHHTFRPGNVLDRARYAACCKFNASAAQVPATLRVAVTGDTGCVSKHSSRDFNQEAVSSHAVDDGATFQCAAYRAGGGCTAP